MKTYYMLTKPGIIFGNAVTTAAGFFLASRGHPHLSLFFITLLGLCLVIASAGVFNSYLDREADAKMERTKNRPLVKGLISAKKALFFGAILLILGIGILLYFTNLLTVFTTLAGFFIYLVLYALWKYRSFYGTLIGSVAGATPPLVGYFAVRDSIDLGALLLFMLIVLWQMPHFFAIAIYRLKDYEKAKIPVLPLVKGMERTKKESLFYIIGFMCVSLLFTLTDYTGNTYFFVTLFLCLGWIFLCLKGFSATNNTLWARSMFLYSLVVIMGISLVMALDAV